MDPQGRWSDLFVYSNRDTSVPDADGVPLTEYVGGGYSDSGYWDHTDSSGIEPGKERFRMLRSVFPLKINQTLSVTGDVIYDSACDDIGTWVAQALNIKHLGDFEVVCTQKAGHDPFTLPVSCDSVAIQAHPTRGFRFPSRDGNDLSYFDAGLIICDTGTRDSPRPIKKCADHGCAGIIKGKKATIFDGASWLEKSDAVKEALTTFFGNAGFELTIINKHYQVVYGNCAMFSAVCVFLMVVYGKNRLFSEIEKLGPADKNRLIETIAVRMRRFATRPESFFKQP
jgi:hypothetical protein